LCRYNQERFSIDQSMMQISMSQNFSQRRKGLCTRFCFYFCLGVMTLSLLAACSTGKKQAPVRDLSSNRKAESTSRSSSSSKTAIKESQKKEAAKSEPKIESAEAKKEAAVVDTGLKLSRPASGQTITNFDGNTNKGIDIAGKAGDPIIAAADGKVVYAGNSLRGYGNLVIVKHDNTYLTAYAHNKTLLVKEGETVKRGQKIAEMGSTEADRVKLHFELRRNGKPIDPTSYLQ